MVYLTLVVSFATAVLELLFAAPRLEVIVPYAVIIPALVVAPRVLYIWYAPLRRAVGRRWLWYIELFTLPIIILNAPASLVFHSMGFQYDRFLHFSAAFLATVLAALFLLALHGMRGAPLSLRRAGSILLPVMITALFAWEFLQFSVDATTGTRLFLDAVQPIQRDFWEDIFFGLFGVLSGLAFWRVYAEAFRERILR